MREARGEPGAVPGHELLLAASRNHRRAGIEAWVRAAVDRGEKVLTVCAPDVSDLGPGWPGHRTSALSPRDLRPDAEPDELVRRALDEGFQGVSIVIWAGGLRAGAPGDHHLEVETALTDLCRRHRVSALCLYERTMVTATAELLDTVVAGHPDAVREQLVGLRSTQDALLVSGEIDMSNVDVLAAALRTVTRTRLRSLRVDLSRVTFLSVSAGRALASDTAEFRGRGGRVEVHGASPHIARVLQLLARGPRPGLELVGVDP